MKQGKNVFLGIIAAAVMFAVGAGYGSTVLDKEASNSVYSVLSEEVNDTQLAGTAAAVQKRTGDAIYALANKEIKALLNRAIADALKANTELVASKKAYEDAKNKTVAGSAAAVLEADLARIEGAYTAAIAAAGVLPSATPAETTAKNAAFKKAENDKKINRNSAQQKYNAAISAAKKKFEADTKRITAEIKTAQELIFTTGDSSKKKALDTAYNTYKASVEAARVIFRDAVKVILPSLTVGLTEVQ